MPRTGSTKHGGGAMTASEAIALLPPDSSKRR
jgi:hypothetical protein